MRALTLLLLMASSLPAFAQPAPAPTSLLGRVALWSRLACAEGEDASRCLPTPNGVEWRADLSFTTPASAPGIAPSTAPVAAQTLRTAPWTVRVQVFYARPPAPEIPYIVTQTNLAHDAMGAIADCTRYDDPRALSSLPPGSCAGWRDGVAYGVSFSKLRN